MPDDYTSVLDKTDWRKTIHKALQDAVLSIGQDELFWYNVEQAMQSMSATYPNWDAAEEVNNRVNEVNVKHNGIAEKWILDHPYDWGFPWTKDIKMKLFKNNMYLEILQNLLNIAAIHRMLLYGRKDTISGSQMNLPGVNNQDDYTE